MHTAGCLRIISNAVAGKKKKTKREIRGSLSAPVHRKDTPTRKLHHRAKKKKTPRQPTCTYFLPISNTWQAGQQAGIGGGVVSNRSLAEPEPSRAFSCWLPSSLSLPIILLSQFLPLSHSLSLSLSHTQPPRARAFSSLAPPYSSSLHQRTSQILPISNWWAAGLPEVSAELGKPDTPP